MGFDIGGSTMSKKYRPIAVKSAVENWDISEWFTAEQLLPKAIECLPQRNMSINVWSVSRYLRVMESKGLVLSRPDSRGILEFTYLGDYDGDAHLYA